MLACGFALTLLLSGVVIAQPYPAKSIRMIVPNPPGGSTDLLARPLAQRMGDSFGRIMVVDSSVNTQHTGHGNVMPNCLHGGPGRAGGGEELAGLRALLLYHRRFVVQGPPSLLESIGKDAVDGAKLFS